MKTDLMQQGAWSHDLAKKLRINVPVLSGKGYSLTIAQPDPAPRIPIMIIVKKVAVTPLPERTKLAGTLELVGRHRNDHTASRRGDRPRRAAISEHPRTAPGRRTMARVAPLHA